MKDTQFSIRDIKVYERLKAESGYSAHIKSTAGQPDKLLSLTIATNEEKGIIDEYLLGAINECRMAISRYLSPCSIDEENDCNADGYMIHRFKVTLPSNYPETYISSLESAVTDFVCSRCLQQWYLLVKSDDADTATLKAQSAMALMRDILSTRTKPH